MNSADRDLLQVLRAWNEAQTGAPAPVEAALRAAYRKRYPRRRRLYAIPFAAAAALLVWNAVPAQAPQAPQRPHPAAPPAFAYVIPRAAKTRPVPAAPRRPAHTEVAAAPKAPAEQFLPLYPGTPMLPFERAQVVRVAIPRAALAPAGLPVDPMRAAERVRADVLMGDDGLIRGIRLVR
jgi:hypothetical protein